MKIDRPLRSLALVETTADDHPAVRRLRGMGSQSVRTFRLGECSVLLSIDQGLWHLSLAHPQRLPRWSELAEARYRLVPDRVTMAMILPPRNQYVNLHPNCLHLYEIESPRGVSGAQPEAPVVK